MEKRDIQFNSFAVLLFKEVKPLMRAWERAHRTNRLDYAARIEGQIQDIFARRGYDLARHTWLESEPEKALDDILDLKEWP